MHVFVLSLLVIERLRLLEPTNSHLVFHFLSPFFSYITVNQLKERVKVLWNGGVKTVI